MKSKLISTAAAFILMAGVALAETPAAKPNNELSAIPPSKAKVQLGQTEFQFGYMPNDASVSHSYWLYSRGEDSLKILRVKPACGCTKAPLKKEVIAVGDSGEVELVFHASAGQRGSISKSATVTCNDNDKGNFQLRFGANIFATDHPDSLTPLTLSTSSVKWDHTTKNETRMLELKNVSSSPVAINLLVKPVGCIDLDLGNGDINPGKTREIKIKVAKDFTGQDFTKSFTFECNDAGRTRYSVPVVLTGQIAAIAPPLDKAEAVKTNAATQSGGAH